jgi:hypothetical protein
MRIGDLYSYVEIEFKEEEPENPSGLSATAYTVQAACNGFSGRIERVWFFRENLDGFLSELQQLEATRRGAARLTNLSSLSEYSPFDFEIYSTDEAGHLAVRVRLLKVNYIEDELHPAQLSFAITLDAGNLLAVIAEFKELFANGAGRG